MEFGEGRINYDELDEEGLFNAVWDMVQETLLDADAANIAVSFVDLVNAGIRRGIHHEFTRTVVVEAHQAAALSVNDEYTNVTLNLP